MLKNLSIHKLGSIGEILPDSVKLIKDLNQLKHNFPVFDVIISVDNELYVMSIKARKKFGKNGKFNSQYNILTGSNKRARKFKLALDLLIKFGYDIEKLNFGFIVAPFEENRDVIYYMGLLSDVNPLFSVSNCLNDSCGNIYVPVKDENLMNYKILGIHTWNKIQNLILEKNKVSLV